MRSFTFFLVFILIAQFAAAQKSVQKGKIITPQKTLDGYVYYSVIEETPQAFSFSETQEGTYVPVPDALRIEMEDGTIYEKAFTSINIVNAEYLSRWPHVYTDSTAQAAYRFLQQQVVGKISLYQFRDFYGYNHFFYREQGDTAVQKLVYKPYLTQQGTWYDDESFRRQLVFLATKADCKASVQKAMEKVPYQAAALIRAIQTINSCSGNKGKDIYTNQNRWKPSLSLVGGVMTMRLNPSGESEDIGRWDWESDLVLGASVVFQPKKYTKGFSAGLEAVYIKYAAESRPYPYYSNPYTRAYGGELLLLRPQLFLHLTNAKVNLYATGGIMVPVVFKEVGEVRFANGFTMREEFGPEITPYAGLGITRQRLSLQWTYLSGIVNSKTAGFEGQLRYRIF
jgi:hypothetical protein